jgi:hypothetical protein
MVRMGRLFSRNYGNRPLSKSKQYVEKAKTLKRVRIGSKSKIVGASEEEIQEIKQGLDTNIIFGREERQSKKQLRRLGFLHG